MAALSVMPSRRDAKIIKIACLGKSAAQQAYLFSFDQTKPLAEIIRSLCEHFGVPDPAQHALKCDLGETSFYITEKNRTDLKDGALIKLALSPSEQALVSMAQMKATNPSTRMEALKSLHTEVKDVTFCNKFIEKNGLPLLTGLIREFRAASNEQTNLGYAVSAYSEIMGHEPEQWKQADMTLMTDILSLCRTQKVGAGELRPMTLRAALLMAAACVRYAADGFNVVARILPLTDLLGHLGEKDGVLQTNALTLLNCLLVNAPNPAVKATYFSDLEAFKVVQSLGDTVTSKSEKITDNMAHELYVLQTMMLSRLQVRREFFFEASDKEAQKNLKLLSDLMSEVESRRGLDPFKQLGFRDPANPGLEFTSPPGLLNLDCMTFFAKQYAESFSKLVIEQSGKAELYACSFARGSARMVDMLLELLDVGKPLSEKSTRYLPLFYSCSTDAFKELYSIGMQLLFKTWKEMEAKLDDFDKVLIVVRKQLLSVLDRPIKDVPNTLDNLKAAVMQFPYSEFHKKEMQVMEDQQLRQLQSSVVLKLQDKHKATLKDLVNKQRLSSLVRGQWFNCFLKNKFKPELLFFCALAPNHKTIHWSDPVPNDSSVDSRPNIATLPHQCEIGDMKVFYVGAEVPSITRREKKVEASMAQLSFAFMTSTEECVEFAALSRADAAVWMDGLRILLGKQPEEPETKRDVDMLLELDMSVALLTVNGIDLPAQAPTVPELPPDFSFFF